MTIRGIGLLAATAILQPIIASCLARCEDENPNQNALHLSALIATGLFAKFGHWSSSRPPSTISENRSIVRETSPEFTCAICFSPTAIPLSFHKNQSGQAPHSGCFSCSKGWIEVKRRANHPILCPSGCGETLSPELEGISDELKPLFTAPLPPEHNDVFQNALGEVYGWVEAHADTIQNLSRDPEILNRITDRSLQPKDWNTVWRCLSNAGDMPIIRYFLIELRNQNTIAFAMPETVEDWYVDTQVFLQPLINNINRLDAPLVELLSDALTQFDDYNGRPTEPLPPSARGRLFTNILLEVQFLNVEALQILLDECARTGVEIQTVDNYRYAILTASKIGNLPVMQFIIDKFLRNNIPVFQTFDFTTIRTLEIILKYNSYNQEAFDLISEEIKKIPFNAEEFRMGLSIASFLNNLPVIQYLIDQFIENETPVFDTFNDLTIDTLRNALKNNCYNKEIFDLISREIKKIPFNAEDFRRCLFNASSLNKLPVIQYLIDQFIENETPVFDTLDALTIETLGNVLITYSPYNQEIFNLIFEELKKIPFGQDAGSLHTASSLLRGVADIATFKNLPSEAAKILDLTKKIDEAYRLMTIHDQQANDADDEASE